MLVNNTKAIQQAFTILYFFGFFFYDSAAIHLNLKADNLTIKARM